MMKQLVVAHRGASGVAPENTLLAFQIAHDIGADMIELDVQQTEDGELVCIHDFKVDRTTNGSGAVAEMSFHEIRELDAGQGQRIPTLAEVLDFCRGKLKVVIELKVTDIEKEILSLVHKRGMLSEIMLCSFLHGTLIEARSLNVDVTTAVLVSKIKEGIVDYVLEMESNALNPDFNHVTPSLVSELHRNELQIFPWTVNDSATMAELYNTSIDGLITNFPDRALEVLRRK
jgi:glycerophosphoryl diester phosphodiesterase